MALDDEQETALRRELEDTKRALKEANKESQGHRLNADRANAAAENAEAAAKKAKDDAVAAIEATRAELTAKAEAAEQLAATTKTETAARVLRAELRAAAVTAGMRDPDDLGALDTSAAKLADDGKVTLPEGFFAKMKEAKPYLFGTAPATTSSTATPPNPDGGKKPASFDDMTADQQAAWKKEHRLR